MHDRKRANVLDREGGKIRQDSHGISKNKLNFINFKGNLGFQNQANMY